MLTLIYIVQHKGEKKLSPKKGRTESKKIVKSHHIKNPDYLLQKGPLRKRTKVKGN